MDVYVASGIENAPFIFYTEEDAVRFGAPYFKIAEESIPSGKGVLKTDGISKFWFEELYINTIPGNWIIELIHAGISEV